VHFEDFAIVFNARYLFDHQENRHGERKEDHSKGQEGIADPTGGGDSLSPNKWR
jgi:hypothetical protein